ncbi:MAG: DNA-3-methyladenine glycosylase 2 family protein [Gammaproteobacteria bacterium]|nr:DNA-3-methyladenine glycosylase 2 family protein [Gammaproteobacteria bacterium]
MPSFIEKITAAEKHLRRVDRALVHVITDVGRCTLRLSRGSPYEALTRAIAYQQLTGRAAQTILDRFVALYPDTRFPEPSAVLATSVARLRAVGFSGNKVKAIHDIAAKANDGVIPTRAQAQRLDDEALVQRLLPIYGVGRWTVEMLLIFTLGRLDVLPVDDFGVQNGLRVVHKLRRKPTKADFVRLTESWRPYRSVGAWYLWRYMDLLKKR